MYIYQILQGLFSDYFHTVNFQDQKQSFRTVYEGSLVVILSCNCISRLTSNLDVPINRTCKCLPKTRERIIRFRPSISLCRALFCLLVHAIMLFAKKGSLFSLQFFFASMLYLSPFSWFQGWKVHFRFCHNLHDDVSLESLSLLSKALPMQIEPPKKHFVVCQNSSSKGEKLLPKSCKRSQRILHSMHNAHLLVNL